MRPRRVARVTGSLMCSVGVAFMVLSVVWVVLLGTGLQRGDGSVLWPVAGVSALVALVGLVVLRAARPSVPNR